MNTATSPSKFSAPVMAAVILCLALGGGESAAVAAQSMPDTENGRYALSPVADGVLRLDTRTGTVSTCNNTGTGWACYAVPDERAALDATPVNIPCSGCGHNLATEGEFARHFILLYGPQYLNLGRCPNTPTRTAT